MEKLKASVFFLTFLLSVSFISFVVISGTSDVWVECNAANSDTVEGSRYCCKNSGYNWDLSNAQCKPSISVVKDPVGNPNVGQEVTYGISASDDETGVKEFKILIDTNDDGFYEDQDTCSPSSGCSVKRTYSTPGQKVCYYAWVHDNEDTRGVKGACGGFSCSTFTEIPQECFTIQAKPVLILSANPTQVEAGGIKTSTITAKTGDGKGGVTVSLSTSRGATDKLSSSTCATQVDSISKESKCSVTISSTTIGTTTITGKASGYNDGIDSVTFIKGICGASTRSSPSVTITPSSQSGKAGDKLTYDVSVTNNDVNCGTETFSLTKTCPDGWTCSLGSVSLSIASGSAQTTTLSVTSPLSAVKGTYNVEATATNNNNPDTVTNSGSGSASYVISTGSTSCTYNPASITFSPSSTVTTGTSVTASSSFGNNCNDKSLQLREDSCTGTQHGSCTVTNGNCQTSFTPSVVKTYNLLYCESSTNTEHTGTLIVTSSGGGGGTGTCNNNGVCGSGETSSSCPSDCPVYPTPPPSYITPPDPYPTPAYQTPPPPSEPCTLTSASIANCQGGACEIGETVSMSATFTGSCTTGSNTFFQIDAKSLDDSCRIEHLTGDIPGITRTNPAISGTTYSGTWIVPSIPQNCVGKTVHAHAAAIWDGAPGTGTQLTKVVDVKPIDSSPVGGFLLLSSLPVPSSCKFALSILPMDKFDLATKSGTHNGNSHTWEIKVDDSSSAACPSGIVYTIKPESIVTVGSCDVVQTGVYSPESNPPAGVKLQSFLLTKLTKGVKIAKVFVKSTTAACTFSFSLVAPDGTIVDPTFTVNPTTEDGGVCSVNGVCEAGETQTSCPNDCFTRVSIDPDQLTPGEKSTVKLDIRDGRYVKNNPVRPTLFIDGSLWENSLCSISNAKLDPTKTPANTKITSNDRQVTIEAVCEVPSKIKIGKHTLRVIPEINLPS